MNNLLRKEQSGAQIIKYLKSLKPDKDVGSVYLDIGCSSITNIPNKLLENTELSIMVDGDANKLHRLKTKHTDCNFKNIIHLNQILTPHNIGEMFAQHIKSKEITVLDLDIDSYDFELLQAILKFKKPYVILAEINEKIPFPIHFYVKYDHTWDTSHFFGMSFASFCNLVGQDYDVVELDINNAVAIRKDVNAVSTTTSYEDLYNNGYKEPRLKGNLPTFNHNHNVDNWLKMQPAECIKSIKEYFDNELNSIHRGYKGKYHIGI